MKLNLFETALHELCSISFKMMLKSNEPSFQALYAHYVIKELEKIKGTKEALKLVHREGHLYSAGLIDLAGNIDECPLAALIQNQRQIKPDLSVSHYPIDNRHTSTRSPKIKFRADDKIYNSVADWLLHQAIITEFKVTGSTQNQIRLKSEVVKDIGKLQLISCAYKNTLEELKKIEEYKDFKYDMNTCMIILDNHQDSLEGKPKYRFCGKDMKELLSIQEEWPKKIKPPIIYVLLKWDNVPTVDKYVEWELV